MWEMIANMIMGDAQKDMTGSGMNMGMNQSPTSQAPGQQVDYAKDGSNADAGLAATTPTATEPGLMSNMATGLLSPYTKGIQGVQDLYNNPGDKQALGSVLGMLSSSKTPQTESNMPSMTSGNLGLPQSSGMQGPMMPTPQARRSGLANQAVGRYY